MIELGVKKKRVGPVKGRHPWIFSGALVSVPDGIAAGTPVKIVDNEGKFLAQGYFNSYSQIAVRLWSFDEHEVIDNTFFKKRFIQADSIRQKLLAGTKTNGYRLVNSENDFLPGLIVDRYGDYFSIQFHTAGIEAYRNEITAALVELFNPSGIYERSDLGVRKHEGAEGTRSLLMGDVPDLVTIEENGIKFLVDIKGGQKTGFFLDQRDKRLALQKYAKGEDVLNCFSYTGGFSMYAMAAGAKRVTSVDISAPAMDLLKENAKLNGFDTSKMGFEVADVKKYLQTIPVGQHSVIILDPPAFIKSRNKIQQGLQGYKKINSLGLRAMKPGDILVSCSCSAHVSLQDFRYLLTEVAGREERSMQILETYTHGVDHLELTAFTEGEYLKTLFTRVL